MIAKLLHSRAAVTAEAAVALPFVLIFALSLYDLSMMLQKRVTIQQLHFQAGRLAPTQSDCIGGNCATRDCTRWARTYLTEKFRRLGISGFNSNATQMTTQSVEVTGLTPPPTPPVYINGYSLSLTVEVPCLVCGVMPWLSNVARYSASTFQPYQGASTCAAPGP